MDNLIKFREQFGTVSLEGLFARENVSETFLQEWNKVIRTLSSKTENLLDMLKEEKIVHGRNQKAETKNEVGYKNVCYFCIPLQSCWNFDCYGRILKLRKEAPPMP